MNIWVDADACPKAIKEILFRAADKRKVKVTLVANKQLYVPMSQYISSMRVEHGFDVADNEIVKMTQPGDLVVTADVPLAAEIVAKGAAGLNPRGELYTKDNVQSCLTVRNFMAELRDSGVQTRGPAPLSRKDRENFANQLDKFLTEKEKNS